MPTDTAPRVSARQRPANRPASPESRGSRGVPATVTVRATFVADLRDEVHAITAERHELGRELAGLSTIAYRAGLVEDPSLALYVAGRLDAIAKSIARRGAA